MRHARPARPRAEQRLRLCTTQLEQQEAKPRSLDETFRAPVTQQGKEQTETGIVFETDMVFKKLASYASTHSETAKSCMMRSFFATQGAVNAKCSAPSLRRAH